MASPPRVLSAGNTRFFKVAPTIIILVFTALILRSRMWPMVFGLWVVVWWTWVAAHFKRVALDDTSLYVSNFRHEIVVPLHDVDRVRERLTPQRAVVLEFTQDTRFGRRIEFSPLGSFQPPGPHPIAIELEIAVGAAKQAKATGSANG